VKEILTQRVRYIIAVILGLVGFLLIAVGTVVFKASWQYYLFPGTCFLVVVTCLTKGGVSRFFGSCIGVCLFLFTCLYTSEEFDGGRLLPVHKGDQSIMGAVVSLLVLGIPGLIYAWKNKFGFSNQDVR
jgi:hypothetical protein